MLKDLRGIRKIHFVGIGGAGMSPLAKVLLEMGYEISGSDRGESEIIAELRKRGAKIYLGQQGENVRGAEAIVVSTAIPYDNPEVLAAGALKIPKLHRSDINAALVNDGRYLGIAVAGAHGKTTTTSMLGVALERLGLDPTIVIGGEVADLGTNGKLGRGKYLVTEADESDGSFLKLKPYIGLVTNVENDHLDHYGTMDNIRAAFTEFLQNTQGHAVVCFDNENLRNIAPRIDCPVHTYAIDHPADYQARNIICRGAGTTFEVWHKEAKLGEVRLNIPGRHNVLNALGATVTGLTLGLSAEEMATGLAEFHGAKRRFQTKGRVKDIWVVDDYAHHPTEIATTIKAARQTNPQRLIIVFQPHRYSRTQLLKKEFGQAFTDADLLVLTDIYAAGERPIEGISGATIFNEVKAQTGMTPLYIKERKDIASELKNRVRAGDLIITMGAGDIYKTGEELVDLLKES